MVTAADGLTDVARHKNRGAFFKSITATLTNLYWANALILQRLTGSERPEETIKHSPIHPSDWTSFKARRSKRDEEIEDWAAGLVDADLDGMVVRHSGDDLTRIEKPKTLCAAGIFNHLTHPRSQLLAMHTAAGAEPEPTSLSELL